MPRIVVKGVTKEDLKNSSKELLESVEKIIKRPKSSFTLDLLESTAILDGEEIKQVYVEIFWKERPLDVCREVAEKIKEIIKKSGYENIYVCFKNLDLEKEFIF